MAIIAYLECPTGLAGDMCLGALVHAGVPIDYLVSQLKQLGIGDEFELWANRVQRNGQQATKVHVDLLHRDDGGQVTRLKEIPETHSTFPPQQHQPGSLPNPDQTTVSSHEHHGRRLPEIVDMIQSSGLPERAIAWSLSIFQTLAEAEGAVHGIPPEQVHFHEVGATDALVDVVGTCLGLDWLKVDQIYCSAVPTGGGTVRAAHGLLPVPAPAVLKLLEMRQVPIYHNGINRELVTPTGAAIATTLATAFGPPPSMTLRTVGLGAGSRDLPIPNILRLWLGETPGDQGVASHQAIAHSHYHHHHAHAHPPSATEPIAVLQTQVDDLNPQAIGYLFERLLKEGAVDVFTQAIGMKKSRPGNLITVLCPPEQLKNCQRIMFQETTTLGVRWAIEQRTILHREFHTVETPLGIVQVKVARTHRDGEIVNVQPEYEDCAAIARAHQKPWHEIHQLALLHWQLSHPHKSERALNEATAS